MLGRINPLNECSKRGQVGCCRADSVCLVHMLFSSLKWQVTLEGGCLMSMRYLGIPFNFVGFVLEKELWCNAFMGILWLEQLLWIFTIIF